MKLHVASDTTLELMALVEDGQIEKALGILDSEAVIDEEDFLEPWGSLQITLVQLAAWCGSLQILERLNARGADLNATDKLGRCALHHAAHEGHVDVVKWLLDHGAAVENRIGISFLPKNQPYTAVDCTATPNYEIGRNLPLPECWGMTALHQAVKAGHVGVVKLLVDGGANVDARDERGATPLHLAAVTVNPDDPKEMLRFEQVIDILVSASVSVNVPHPDTGTTALHHAVTLGNREATQRLLEGGAWPAVRCASTGITPLHIASSAGFYETLDILLSYVDSSLINVQDEIGRTPLHAAAYRGHLKCIRALVDHGGSLASKTKTGVTVIDAIFGQVARPVAFVTDILDARVRATDKTVNQVHLDFRVLAPRGELQMSVVSALIGAVPLMEQMTILQHPLVEAFLGMKWSRLRRFFFMLVIVHVCFVLSLSGYAISLLREGIVIIPRRLLLFFACIVLCHNLLQLLIVPRIYARQFETWLSMTCVMISIVVAMAEELSPPGMGTPSWVLQCISIAILFAWIEMMLLVGRFPTWGHYALMFSTVLKNVSKVLLAFVWLIVGFALSFLVLFHGNDQFDSSWRALVKTVVMMMGEYEYSDLFAVADKVNDSNSNGNKNNHSVFLNSTEINTATFLPVTSRIIFLIFVMLASIVLMNLMIGLAVSDIQGLLNEGHIRRLLKQAAFVAHLEWVTSHRIFRSRLVHRFLRAMLESKKTIPTRITLGMFTGYENGVHGIPEELVEVIFSLAAKNRELEKQVQKAAIGERKEDSLLETISSLENEVKELKRDKTRTQRMQSIRNKNPRRKKSVAV